METASVVSVGRSASRLSDATDPGPIVGCVSTSAMNELIAAGRRSPGGLIDRMAGVSLPDERREALQTAIADYERSVKRGDNLGRDMADARIDALLDEARAARQPQEEEPAPRVSFDGGVRRSVSVKQPVGMGRLIREAHAERQALAAHARASV